MALNIVLVHNDLLSFISGAAGRSGFVMTGLTAVYRFKSHCGHICLSH